MFLHKMKNPQINLKKAVAGQPAENNKPKQSVAEKLERSTVVKQFKKEGLNFPENFLWGTSTSAYQVEGGIKNDWSEWEKSPTRINKLKKQGQNPKDYICGQACDFYHRFSEDFQRAAKELNNNAIRFGLEWARIEPGKNTWNIEAINHYRKMLTAAKEEGLETAITIWHWTNPIWVARAGGWANKNITRWFLRYLELVINEFGALIDWWVVLNEPMIHISNGYLTGKFPPNKRNPFLAIRVYRNLVETYRAAYHKIHQHFPRAQVGFTQIVNYFEPAHRWCPVEQALAKIAHWFWNHKFLSAVKNEMDYIGLDYYFHDRLVWYPPFRRNRNQLTTDMGWEIYSEGIYYVLKYLDKFKKPILVLENGLADERDQYRADFIRDHLRYIHKAINEGVDVRGYFYWSLLDNFEWAEGWGPKFGLYEVDRKTFARTPRPSVKVYGEICRENGI